MRYALVGKVVGLDVDEVVFFERKDNYTTYKLYNEGKYICSMMLEKGEKLMLEELESIGKTMLRRERKS